ncbi:MAG: long-chain fatty acid--CoA ligase [Micrococcaceae bacterium]|nr:long-chain fatty acid--CoA ligase [Micrococcaceae bacterium]
MSGQNIGLGSWPARRARLTPHSVALRYGEREDTYREQAERVEALAAGFRNAGISRGDRVAYFGANHPDLLTTLFAAARIGAITVLLNARLSPAEISFMLADSDTALLIHGPEVSDTVEHLNTDVGATLHTVDVDSPGFTSMLLDEAIPHTEVDLDDACLLMYTSGTTGQPKGAVLTHGNLFFNDVNVLIETDLTSHEVCLAVAPLFHIAGLNGLVLPVILKGGTIEILPSFIPQTVLETIRRRQVTCMFGVPAMLDALSAEPAFSQETLASLNTVIVGGAPVPQRTLRRWSEHDVDVQQGYGLTETSPAVLKLAAEDARDNIGSAGKPQFFVDVRLDDPSGKESNETSVGEILTRGPNVFREYWNRPDATQSAFHEDWFRTGDIATVDAKGFYTLKDRSKDMYISGGENIYPAEIETLLMDIEGVAEAAVVGMDDPKWGEVGRAFIVTDGVTQWTEATLLDALQDRLARYKQPKSIVFVDELPRTSTGKLRKNTLREQAQESE